MQSTCSGMEEANGGNDDRINGIVLLTSFTPKYLGMCNRIVLTLLPHLRSAWLMVVN